MIDPIEENAAVIRSMNKEWELRQRERAVIEAAKQAHKWLDDSDFLPEYVQDRLKATVRALLAAEGEDT